jgi:hypothetical protein
LVGDAGDPEVRDAGEPVRVEEDVRWLEVAMDDASAVGDIERTSDAAKDRERIIEGERPAGEPVGERTAVHRLHHEERLAIVLAEVVDADEGLVTEAGHGAGLAFETSAEDGVLHKFAREDLDCNVAVEVRVMGEVHDCHAAAAELAPDLIAADL